LILAVQELDKKSYKINNNNNNNQKKSERKREEKQIKNLQVVFLHFTLKEGFRK